MLFIFLIIVWNTSAFASGDTTIHRRILLGCQTVIPCQHYRKDSNSLKWYYKKDAQSNRKLIYSIDKTGIPRRTHDLITEVLRNGSLVIDHVAEKHQGLYWCKGCFIDGCLESPLTAISLEKEILTETHKTAYVVAGSSFTHACSIGQFINFKWTFEASDMNSVRGSRSDFLTSNKSINILNVERANAGKYTCWKSGCYGEQQKLLTINLCVITVNVSEVSADSCAVICDKEFSDIKPNSTLNLTTGTRTISVLVDPNGAVYCILKQMFDGYSTVNSIHYTSNTSQILNTTDIPTEPEYQFAVIYGPLAAVLLLILIALLIYYRARLLQAFPALNCCRGLNDRAEEEVVYSSVVFMGPPKTTNDYIIYNKSSCVYSEVKVKREVPK